MKEYLLSVIGIVLLSSVLTSVLSDGKTSGMVKSVSKLACVLVILTPFCNFFKKSGNFEENYFSQSVIKIDENFIEYCSEKAIKQAETEIENDVLKAFSITSDVSLKWQYSYEAGEVGVEKNLIKITEICIKIKSEEREKISAYLTEKYGCEARVEIWT